MYVPRNGLGRRSGRTVAAILRYGCLNELAETFLGLRRVQAALGEKATRTALTQLLGLDIYEVESTLAELPRPRQEP